MEKEQIPTINVGDMLDGVKAFFKSYFRNWKKIAIAMLIGASLGLAYFFIQSAKYQAEASFVLEEKGGMGGGLSGLASQFGFDIGSLGGGGGLFAGDNILDILKSRKLVEQILLSKVDSTNANSETLADAYLRWSGLRKKLEEQKKFVGVHFNRHPQKSDVARIQDSVLFVIYQKLINKHIAVDRLNKKGSIIQVKVAGKEEVFCKLFTERLVAATMKMYVDIKTSVAVKNISRLESRADSLLQILNAKSIKSASLQVLDANVAYKTAAVPVEVTQREKSVTYALYTEVVKNLEASKMSLAAQTPVIYPLDTPRYPLENHTYPLLVLLLFGIVAALFATLAIAFATFKG